MASPRLLAAVAGGVVLLAAGSASAQSQWSYGQSNQNNQNNQQQPSARDQIGNVLGALLGDRLGLNTSVDAQWQAGRQPLNAQRSQFFLDVDGRVAGGTLSSDVATRIKSDYDAAAQLEARYGADGRYITQERTELNDRYGALTQALADGGYADTVSTANLPVAGGRTDFNARVDAAVSQRRLTRTDGSRLRSDYDALIQVEAGYARDGGLSAQERADLDARLDALDARVGDGAAYTHPTPQTPRDRLAALETAIANGERNGAVSRDAAAQLRVELGDLVRLEQAYARLNPSNDDTAYLTRRIGDLEMRARVNR